MQTIDPVARLVAALGALAVALAACGVPVATVSPSPGDHPLVSPAFSTSPPATFAALASPTGEPSATASPSPPPAPAVATRVVVDALGIDLPVVKSPPAGVYPYCNVAMYLAAPFGQPGERRTTYLFAHARTGMFGPIYVLTMVRRTPNKMIGMAVEVYTSDSMVHTYRIVKVLPHQRTLKAPASVQRDQLWLQTSEGPRGTPGKTQVVADPVAVAPTDAEAAHPAARIVACGA